MAWTTAITGIFSTIGSAIGALFGFKKEQAEAVKQAIGVVGDISASNAQREQAIATIIASESGSGYWLSACWRPLVMVFFAVLIGARWFGYTPPNMSEAELLEVYGLLKLGIGGYIGGRTIEKIFSSINIGSILKKFIEKKVL